jgi:hypothetical protein
LARLTVVIALAYTLEQVSKAYEEVGTRHIRGEIVLSPVPEFERENAAY